MKKETFIKTIENIKDFYDATVLQDKKIQEALGGDTQVMTEWHSKYIEKMLEILSEEMGDTSDTIDWLFWDSVCSMDGEYMTFEIDGNEYLGTPENIWKELKQELTVDDAIKVQDPEEIEKELAEEIFKKINDNLVLLRNNRSNNDELFNISVLKIMREYEDPDVLPKSRISATRNSDSFETEYLVELFFVNKTYKKTLRASDYASI
jgi:hypothetical protein